MAELSHGWLSRTVVPLGLAAALAGCAIPDLPRLSPDMGEPPHTVAFIRNHGTEEGEVLLEDLCGAHGLKVSIDKVTAHRFLTDRVGNKVVVVTGQHEVTINGIVYPLNGEVRWRNGKIVLPGEARVVFGEHLKREAIGDLADFKYLDDMDADGGSVLRALRRAAAPTTQKGAGAAGIKIDPNAPPLPASWNVSAHREWQWIVIHHSATPDGGAASFNRSHSKKWENGLGYHFVIGNGTETRDGEIEVGSRWLRQNQGIDGAHAGVEKYNKHGIGVCLVGDFDKTRPTPKQLAALRNLCVHLMGRYGIAKDHIIGHKSVKVGHTECPGTGFPLDEVLRSF